MVPRSYSGPMRSTRALIGRNSRTSHGFFKKKRCECCDYFLTVKTSALLQIDANVFLRRAGFSAPSYPFMIDHAQYGKLQCRVHFVYDSVLPILAQSWPSRFLRRATMGLCFLRRYKFGDIALRKSLTNIVNIHPIIHTHRHTLP
jgi:hypothetical protein